jgi:DNA-binding MarR family transcriptional regulator
MQEQVCEDIVALLGKLKNVLLEIADEQNITRIQLSALYSISKTGELPMGRVADVLHCDPSNVTGLVDRLVTQGLITRQECATDRRAKTLRLTPKGQEVVSYIHQTLPSKLDCSRLAGQELQQLHSLILKLL